MDAVLLTTGLRVVEMMSISLQKKNNYNIEPKVCIRSVFSFFGHPCFRRCVEVL